MITALESGVSKGPHEVSHAWCHVEATTEAEAHAIVDAFLKDVRGDRKALMRTSLIVLEHRDFEHDTVRWRGVVRFARLDGVVGEIVDRLPFAETPVFYGTAGQ